jgi:flagellar basal-body rod protein FlgF
MVELTQTMRHFESILRMAQGRDEMLGIALRKLGEN